MQNINVNIVPDNFPQTIRYSQGDIGRQFKINVTDFDIPVGATVKIQATKPSGFGFSVAGVVADNSVTFTTTAEMTDEAGRFQAELQITAGDDVIGTANFLMIGERNPHPEGTTDGSQGTIIPELTLLVERVEKAASDVLDMEVVATTLPAGSQATYSYDEDLNKATFGIPEGQAGAGAAGVVASAYSAAKTYKVGDYVLYNSNLYRCTTAITTAEAWTAAHWTQVVLADDVTDLKTDLSTDRNILASVSTPDKFNLDLRFVQGAIYETDPFRIYSSTSIVCMKEILCVEDLDELEIICNTGWQIDLWVFTDKTLASRVRYTNWTNGYVDLLTQKYIFIMGRKSDNSNITPAEFKANVTIKAKRHSLIQDLDKISFLNQTHIYSKDDLVYAGTILNSGAYGANGNGFTSTLFRAVTGDTITFSILTESTRKAFVVYDKTGNINYSVNGNGTSTALNHSYTFQSGDYWFAFVSYYTDSAKNVFNATYTSNRKIYDYRKGINSIITMSDFEGMFQIGALNPLSKSWVSSSYGIVQRKDFPVKLSIGDRIYLTDTTGIHWRVMYLPSGSATREISAWQTISEYVVKESGQYWIEIETYPTATVTNMDSLVSIIRVVKNDSFYDTLSEDNIANQRTDWIVKSINHRGMNLIAPENTMPAFKLSAQLGWKYVETDVAETSDGVIVLLHDETINRTARNADGTEISETISINDITYNEALEYDFGIWKGDQYAGTKIPTLDEFLKFSRKVSLNPYIDLGSSTDVSMIESVIDLIKRNGMVSHTTILATNVSALETVKGLCDYIRLGLIATPSAQTIANIKSLRTGKNEVFLDTQTGNYGTEEIIQSLVAEDIPLETYTPNNSTEIDQLDPYVTGVTSDYLVAGKILYNESL